MGTRTRSVMATAVLVTWLSLSAGCTWAFPRFDIGGTGTNTAETTLTLANAGGLHEVWKTPPLGLFRSDPVTSGSTVFVVGQQTLYAFDLAGTTGCAGTPRVCQPLWTAAIAQFASPSVVGSTVFVAGAAYDAAGTTGCSGTPKVCQPLFSTAPTFTSSVSVGNLLYATPNVTGADAVLVFDATGTTGCAGSPKVCTPLRTLRAACPAGETCTARQPVLSGDRVFVGIQASSATLLSGRIAAFDRTGATGCSGTPVVCTPLWTRTTGAPINVSVAGDTVHATTSTFSFVGPNGPDTVLALAADTGATRWSATAPSFVDLHAVAGGQVVVAASNEVLVYPAACTTPCAPTRRAPVAGFARGPVVANGVIYSGTSTALQLFAADGSTGCSGAPVTCVPVATVALPVPSRVVAVQSGRVLVAGNDDQVLRAFGL